MYESPIEIIQTEMQMQMDEGILKAVQGVGIDVDKEELLKALAYDREQYSKGYKDGMKEFAERLESKYTKVVSCNAGYVYRTIKEVEKEMVGGENA